MPTRASPSVGHGENVPDASAYLKALALEVGMQKRKADLRETHKRVRKAIEGSGVVLKDLDTLYKKRDDSAEEIEGWLRRQFAAFSSVFGGLRRFDFMTERGEVDRMESRRLSGRLAGIATDDDSATPPAGLIEDELQAWTEGFQEGASARSAAEPVLADILAEALQNADEGRVTDGTGRTPLGRRGVSKRARQRAAVEMVRAQAESDFAADNPTKDEASVGA